MKKKKSTFKIFLQVRYDSKRLPGKALLPFPEKNMLNFLIKRLKTNKYNIPIILLTTNRKVDKKLILCAKKNKIKYFAGSYKNVYKRFLDASDKFKVDNIIRICADNPLTDIKILEDCVEKFSKNRLEHLSTFHKPFIPYGTGCAIFKSSILKRFSNNKLNKFDKEHVEPILLRSKKIKTFFYKSRIKKNNIPNLNLTVDTSEDYKFIKSTSETLYKKYKLNFTIKEIYKVIKKPKLLCFLNSSLGLSVLKKLISMNIKIDFAILHPPEKSQNNEEIAKILRKSKIEYYIPKSFDKTILYKFLKGKKFDLGLTIWSSYIFSPEIINLFPRGIVNLHNSFLPENKGSNANIFYILQNKKPGATIHYVNSNIDSGAIIDQEYLKTNLTDTGFKLQKKMEMSLVRLLLKNWDRIIKFYRNDLFIPNHRGNYNKKNLAYKFKFLKSNKNYKALDLINILRAFTFKNYEGATMKYNKDVYQFKLIIKKK